jgi:hypothetical protein
VKHARARARAGAGAGAKPPELSPFIGTTLLAGDHG